MAFYLVTARLITERIPQLRGRLERREIAPMRPFGQTLQHSMENARVYPDGRAVWEEEDYCSPPLKEEREALLDEHFRDIRVQKVRQGEGWQRIRDLPYLMPEFGGD